jgi:putative acetyltransferase
MQTAIHQFPNGYYLRTLESCDNQSMKLIIERVLEEFGCIGPGWASGDAEMNDLCVTYSRDKCKYLVLVNNEGKVIGGGGYSMLKGTEPDELICELQKLYFLECARGIGAGRKLAEELITCAKRDGFRLMYLESTPQLSAAVKMYEKLGFKRITENLGNTGHQRNCSIFMTLDLT